MTSEASVARSWIQTVLAGAAFYDLSAERVLQQAGLDPAELARERWPIDQITRLWRAAAALSADDGFGLEVGRHISLASVNVVGFILQSAATLRAALELLQRYQRLVSDGGRWQLLPGSQGHWLIYHPCQGELAFSRHQIEAVMAALVHLAQRLYGLPLQAQQVSFSHARGAELTRYHSVFGSAPLFEQAFNGLLIDAALLDQALPQADARLAQLHDAMAQARLHGLHTAQTPLERLQSWLLAHPGPPAPTRRDAARQLGLSERTLARQLQRQGSSFQRLLDDVRRIQALEAAAQTTLSWSEIARRLDYSDVSAFYRAFIRWTGATPARWRQEHRRN